jgi:predicted peptidase
MTGKLPIPRFSRLLKGGLGLTLLAALIVARHVAPPPVAAQSPAPVETGFLNGQVTANGKTMVYSVYVPRDYAPEKQWPVILFLHGGLIAGHDGFEPVFADLPRGGDCCNGFATAAGNLGVAVMRHPQRFPCLVVFPEQPSAGDWNGSNEDLALRALEEVVVKYNGDRNRIYLTGISLGGEGTWKVASDHPALFAAAIPIGSSDNQNLLGASSGGKPAKALKSMPLWVFHGGADGSTSPKISRKWVAAIQAAGSTNVQYTEFPGLHHNVWDMVYDTPDVIKWLLAQKR